MYKDYKNRMSRKGLYMGETMRLQSDTVVNSTWMNSVSTYPAVVHSIAAGLPPTYISIEDYDEPFYVHFEEKSKYNAGSNAPAYYLTFAPGVIYNNPDIKVGSYVNIPLDGVCAYWLIINISDDNELPQCQIIKCNWTLKWVSNNIIYNTLCVLRSNSDSAGIETAGQLSTVDSVLYVWAPTNLDIAKINYNTRFLISDTRRATPLAWQTSRIFDVTPIGLTRLSLNQNMYNNSTDNAILMLADYSIGATTPSESVVTPIGIATIIYSGINPTVKVGGSWKTFTVNGLIPQIWSINDGVNTFSTSYGDYIIEYIEQSMRLKVRQNYDLVGKILTIEVTGTDSSTAEVSVEVVS